MEIKLIKSRNSVGQGDSLDSVTFVTDKGTRSPTFGGSGGDEPHTYNIPSGQRLAGIYGYRFSYLKGLGFYLTSNTGYTITKLPVYGDYNSGSKFEWIAPSKSTDLKGIEGRSGWCIDKMKFKMTNGQESPYFGGGSGGDAYDHVLAHGVFVTSADFRFGDRIDSVTFKTNIHSSFKVGGSGGHTTRTQNLPAGARIIGVYGSQNGFCVNSIGLIIAE